MTKGDKRIQANTCRSAQLSVEVELDITPMVASHLDVGADIGRIKLP